jgi:mannosyltransferase
VVVLAVLGLPDQVAVRAAGAHDWWNYPAGPTAGSFSYSGAAAVITQGYRPGDGLVPIRDVMPYYFIDTGLRYNLPADVRPRDVFAAHTGIELSEFFTADTTDPQAALGPERRLWLVTVGHPADPLQGMAPDKVKLLRDKFTVTRIVYPSDYTTVALLERKAGKP